MSKEAKDAIMGAAYEFRDAHISGSDAALTAPQPEQEPLTFEEWYDNAIWGNEDFKQGCRRAWNAAIKYTTPPAAQRQWVDLTDGDLVACSDSQKATVFYFMKKLKEKNT